MVCAVVLPLVAWGRLVRVGAGSPRGLGWLAGAGSVILVVLALAVLDLLTYQHQLYVGGNGHVVVTSCTLLQERIDAEVLAGEVSRVVLRRGPSGATLRFERQEGRGTSPEVRIGSEETARLLADRIGAPLVIE